MIPECKKIRQDILRISHTSGHGHIPTCFSIVEILHAVYDVMKHDPSNPAWDERDCFILSKGHASLALYCTLSHYGYFELERVNSFGSFQADFGCHADRLKIPGIEASTGSLGHGIALAVGIALAFKLKKSDRKVYTVIGDGESNEGSVWEAIQVADSLDLDNLTIVYDNNLSHSRGLQVKQPEKKLEAFGCHVFVVDGHDLEDLKKALNAPANGVKAVVANTVKGYGCPTLSRNHYEWHRKSPDEHLLNTLLEELDASSI
jgi:transketolase